MIRLIIIIGCCIAMLFSCESALAQDAQTILDTSFNQMPAFREGGSVPDIGADTVGYDTSREWSEGDLPADVVKLGDIEDGLGAEELTLGQIGELTGLDLDELKIGQLDFLQGMTLDEFVKDIPFLEEWSVEDISELAESTGLSGSLGDIVETELGDMQVTDVFGAVAVSDIPNMESMNLGGFDNIGSQTISSVPGLGDVSLNSFPIPVAMPSLNFFPIQDIPFEDKEYSGSKSTPQPVSGGTGGTEIWQPMACSGGCAHIELHDSGWEGANWMTKAHRVKDGFGVLGSMIDEAGAYRVPFGPWFALQVDSTDEKTGKAEWGIAFRVCYRGTPDLGCTAYFMEVPLGIETNEGDNILAGIRDGLGGSTVPMKAPPEWKDLQPETPSELQGFIDSQTKPVSSQGGRSLCGDGPGGVNWDTLSKAYESIESLGSGGYGAVGIWVSLSYSETGRAFGRYQYMSYRSDVVEAVSRRPGGAELLRKARIKGASITAEELLSVFPPEEQDALFLRDQEYMIEKAMAAGYSGDRLLEVLSQMHFRGPSILSSRQLDSTWAKDDLGTSMYEYGQRFKRAYREIEKKNPNGDSKCKATGELIHPVKDGAAIMTSPFNPSRIHPIKGTPRPHTGDDWGANQGTPIVASDGGTVTWGNNPGGYGWWIVVNHGNGYETLYAHLSERIAPAGSKVQQGDVIGLMGGAENTPGAGGSNGPHLHFEVIENGVPVPPSNIVNYSKTTKDL